LRSILGAAIGPETNAYIDALLARQLVPADDTPLSAALWQSRCWLSSVASSPRRLRPQRFSWRHTAFAVSRSVATKSAAQWTAGPLTKGSNLCHGTGGNGYAFLKLYRRTTDVMLLERARNFAMTALAQCREARNEFGRGRYSLWTGDVGLAIYLWDCLTGVPCFPNVDIF
jgi:hypothetical protein